MAGRAGVPRRALPRLQPAGGRGLTALRVRTRASWPPAAAQPSVSATRLLLGLFWAASLPGDRHWVEPASGELLFRVAPLAFTSKVQRKS